MPTSYSTKLATSYTWPRSITGPKPTACPSATSPKARTRNRSLNHCCARQLKRVARQGGADRYCPGEGVRLALVEEARARASQPPAPGVGPADGPGQSFLRVPCDEQSRVVTE